MEGIDPILPPSAYELEWGIAFENQLEFAIHAQVAYAEQLEIESFEVLAFLLQLSFRHPVDDLAQRWHQLSVGILKNYGQ